MTKNQQVLIENNYGLVFKVLKDLSLDVWYFYTHFFICHGFVMPFIIIYNK